MPANRRDLASALRSLDVPGPVRGRRRSAAADDDQLAALRSSLRRHPVHGCEDREAIMLGGYPALSLASRDRRVADAFVELLNRQLDTPTWPPVAELERCIREFNDRG